MTLPREVIQDLLPVYVSGEASAKTRELVEEHLRSDPELARRVRDLESGALADVRPALPMNLELRALERTRRRLGLLRWVFGLAIAFTSMALATRISFERGHVRSVGLLLFEYPGPFGACLAVAAALWVAYAAIRRGSRIG